MKKIAGLIILCTLGGCAVSANNHHFALGSYGSKSYDEFSNTWCFVASNAGEVVMCSAPYQRHSKSIGFIVPIVPQTHRESRLAYDIVRSRAVEFKNVSKAESVVLDFVAGFEVCSDSHAKSCNDCDSVTINPGGNVWLKVPSGAIHEVGVTIGENKFRAVLEEFIDSRWHLVSV